MIRILFISGIPDDTLTSAVVKPDGSLFMYVHGSCNLNRFLPDLQGKRHVFCIDSQPGLQKISLPFRPNIIFNEISDPDSHTHSLEKCTDFCTQVNVPTLNTASAIQQTRRDIIAQNLQGIKGIYMPRTIRIQPFTPDDVISAIREADITYPLIFRKAGVHGGMGITLIKEEIEIEKAMYAYALDGGFFYLTEFLDFVSDDGNYRKYRIVVVEGQPYLRHMIVSNSWLIHSKSREFMRQHLEFMEEETQVMEVFDTQIAPSIAPAIKKITDIIGLDYYGIDCTLNGDEVRIFEANANMNILINNQNQSTDIWDNAIAKISNHLTDLVNRRAAI